MSDLESMDVLLGKFQETNEHVNGRSEVESTSTGLQKN